MENLEVKIIKNLNKLLKPYNLIIKPIYFNESTYFNSTINLCNWEYLIKILHVYIFGILFMICYFHMIAFLMYVIKLVFAKVIV
jgi:hypothetical protein